MSTTPPAGWPRLMDEATAAAYLGVSASTLNRIKNERHLVQKKVRGLLRYDIRDLDVYADGLDDAEPKAAS
mgnify:CR=1 FL=1